MFRSRWSRKRWTQKKKTRQIFARVVPVKTGR